MADFGGDVRSLPAHESLLKDYPDYDRFEIERDDLWNDGYALFGYRAETNEEIVKRVEKEKKARAARKVIIAKEKIKKTEAEKKLLRDLKKKYPNEKD